ncbi:MAG: M28 family peptidase, partial [Myxococcaceae bacterium]
MSALFIAGCLGTQSGNVYTGANDNASGTAMVIALARAFKLQAQPPRRTTVFVTFGFEENDDRECEGSEFYVANSPDTLPAKNIVYMM